MYICIQLTTALSQAGVALLVGGAAAPKRRVSLPTPRLGQISSSPSLPAQCFLFSVFVTRLSVEMSLPNVDAISS